MTNLALPLESTSAPPSTVQLYHGDCLEVMPTLKPGSVAMVFADLPYGLLKWTNWDKSICLASLWRCVSAVASEHHVAAFCANMRFAARLIASNERDFRYDLVWSKSSPSNPFLATKRPLNYHENILVFASTKHTYNPQMRPATQRVRPENKNRSKATSYNKFYDMTIPRSSRLCGPMHPSSIVSGCNERKEPGRHPTQKPLALLEWLIATYTNPGDTVLDPTMGSGVAGMACARLGRNFVGIEMDKGYFDVASKRIADERTRLGLTDA